MAPELTDNQILEIKNFLLKFKAEEAVLTICREFTKTPECSATFKEIAELHQRKNSVDMYNFFNKVSEDVCLLIDFKFKASSEVLRAKVEIDLCTFTALNIGYVEDLLTPVMFEEISEILSH